jgi:serine/threonine protein kinase
VDPTKHRYRVGERLGGGGMAEVYKAHLRGAEGFERAVAIKRILTGYSSDDAFAEMFIREARLASRLSHPNITQIIDFDRDDDGHLFIVMELVEGRDLKGLAASGPLPLSVSLFVVGELLRALDYAHRLDDQGRPLRIVHRDVTPHNVLLSWEGAVKLTDFGIAKALAESPMTQTGVVKGKAAYLSPEQARAEKIDARSDLFAVGVILHELVRGQRLFGVEEGAVDMVVVRRVLKMDIPSLRLEQPEVSPLLDNLCMRLLAREPDARFSTAHAALEALLSLKEYSARGQLELATLMRERFGSPSSPPAGRPVVPSGVPKGDFTGVSAMLDPEHPTDDADPRPPPSELPTDDASMAKPDSMDVAPTIAVVAKDPTTAETELPDTAPPPGTPADMRRTERLDVEAHLERIRTSQPDALDIRPMSRPEVGATSVPDASRSQAELVRRANMGWWVAIVVLLGVGAWALVQLLK